mgnify:CR=1 FL=1
MRILLEAPILTRSGYGEHARLVFRALKSISGADIYIKALQWGNTSWTFNHQDEIEEIRTLNDKFLRYEAVCKAEKKEEEYDIQVHVGIPSEFEKRAPYSVCVTAGIETDRVSFDWVSKTHNGMNKIIVPSEHSADGFRKTKYEVLNKTNQTQSVVGCNCPVEVVPYPVKKIKSEDIDINLVTPFNFLTVALLGHRKNIENSLKWFVEEFKNNNQVGFVLKTSTSRSSILDRQQTKKYLTSFLKSLGPRECKVYLLHGDLTDSQVHSLYENPKIKAYVTTTHGEGFGLPIFEAAYSGVPVIATDWSGHLDFLSGPFKESNKTKNKKLFARVNYELNEVSSEAIWPGIIDKDSRWAYPLETDFKSKLNKVYNNYGMYKKWAQSLKSHLEKTHLESIILEKMRQAILPQEILDSFEKKSEWEKELSEIEIL